MLERGSAAKQVAHELGLLGVDASRGRRAGCDLHTGAVTADTGADADRALSAARQAGRNRVCAAAATA